MRQQFPVILAAAFGLTLSMVSVAGAASECGPQTEVPEPDRIVNTLKWTTASEQDNFGYDVYRGNSEDGPFERITATPVPGSGTTDETHSYSYRDSTIDPCKAYWYYVESISTNGQRERFTPVFRAPAKRGPDAAPAASSSP